MGLGAPDKTESLLARNKHSVELLKKCVETQFPDLKLQKSSHLKDGSAVDDIYYLRYVLSSKEPLTTEEQVQGSKALNNIVESFKWRNSVDRVKVSSTREKHFLGKIPLLRTGELPNGFPVVFLPVNRIDFDYIFKNQGDKRFEAELLEFFLMKRDHVFKELDKKTRKRKELVKSVTVYDLNGMSFSSIYRLTKFFKLMQNQSKKFKQYFPQSTHTTVIVNSPGSWVLKSFAGSSKQKVMSVNQFLSAYDAKNAVPEFIGGTFKWPKTPNDMHSTNAAADTMHVGDAEVKAIQITPIPSAPAEEMSKSYHDLRVSFTAPVDDKKLNKKVVLTELERDMIHMKKNKLFSIDVLEKNQQINLFFSNLQRKNAHILVVRKERVEGKVNQITGEKVMFSTAKDSAVITPGFGSLTLKLTNPGEVLLVYLDRKKVAQSQLLSVETMNLKKSARKRVLNFGKKMYYSRSLKPVTTYKPYTMSLQKLRRLNKLTDLNLEDVEVMSDYRREANEHDPFKKLLFRFDVSDAVVCGEFDGNKSISDADVKAEFGDLKTSLSESSSFSGQLPTGMKITENGLIDYADDKSIISTKSHSSLLSQDDMLLRRKINQEPSFLKSVGQIFGVGW